jgi:hypothetical protein
MSAKSRKKPNKIKYISARLRHKKVLEHVSKGMSIEKAMLKEGYAATSARVAKVTATKTWPTLLKTVYNDERLAKIHEGLFNAHDLKSLTFPMKVPDSLIRETVTGAGFTLVNIYPFMGKKFASIIAPDNDIVDKALDKAFKLKKRYTDDINLTVNKYQDASDAEIAAIISKQKKFFKKQ